jgi:hypothetical protein
LLGIGHEQIAIDILDPKRRVADRDVRIDELETGGENLDIHTMADDVGRSVYFDFSGAEVGRKEEDAVGVGAKDEPFVDGTRCDSGV